MPPGSHVAQTGVRAQPRDASAGICGRTESRMSKKPHVTLRNWVSFYVIPPLTCLFLSWYVLVAADAACL